MPAIDLSVLCIPAECDNIKLPIECEIASRWDAYLLCDICRHFASVMLHFASLISHNLRCIPAYTHQIPTGFICFGIHLNFWCVLVCFCCFVTIYNPMIYNKTSSKERFFWWWGWVGVGWQFWWGKLGKCGKLFVVLHYIWTIVGFFLPHRPLFWLKTN